MIQLINNIALLLLEANGEKQGQTSRAAGPGLFSKQKV